MSGRNSKKLEITLTEPALCFPLMMPGCMYKSLFREISAETFHYEKSYEVVNIIHWKWQKSRIQNIHAHVTISKAFCAHIWFAFSFKSSIRERIFQ